MSYLTLADFKLRFFQRLGLGRLWDWTPQDARRVWELDAISTVCGLLNSSASLAAMEGLLVFHGVKVLRDGSSSKSKAGAGSIERIPDLYFRLTRNLLDDGTIDALGDAADVSMRTFAAIRNGGEDHPSWCEVHVERDGAERFLESRQSYVAELVKDLRGIPAGEQLRPSEVLKFLVAGVDAPANPNDPEVSRAQDARHFIAENLVLEAAQLGHLKIQGKPARGQFQQIDSEVFRQRVSVSTISNDLYPYSFIDVFDHEHWTDIRIDGEGFRQWIQENLSPPDYATDAKRTSAIVDVPNGAVVASLLEQGTAPSQVSGVVSNRPPVAREAAQAYLRKLPASQRNLKIAALVADMKQQTGRDVSLDTMRRARQALTAKD